MDLDQAREFVRHNPRAVLATRGQGDRIQQSPVLVGVDDAGRLVVSSREPAVKVRNLRSDARAQVCVFTKRFFGDWVYVDGEAAVVPLPEAEEPLVDYYRAVSGGEHDDWDDYRESLHREQRVLIRIEPTRAGPDRSG